MKLHLNHNGRPLCGVRSWQYIGDKATFDAAGRDGCKRCGDKILSGRYDANSADKRNGVEDKLF